jgi:hypothetical protein
LLVVVPKTGPRTQETQHKPTMGASTSKPLRDLSTEEVANAVQSKGPKFGTYAEAICDNGVDGGLLASLDEDTLAETFEDLGITNRLHKRVLAEHWKQAKEQVIKLDDSRDKASSGGEGVVRTPEEVAEREASMNQYLELLRQNPKMRCQPITEPPEEIREKLLKAVEEYTITMCTSSEELAAFDRIASKAFTECGASACYAAVNLLDGEGHLSAACRAISSGSEGIITQEKPCLVPKDMSACYRAILAEESDLIYLPLLPDTTPFNTNAGDKSFEYMAHIVKSEKGERIAVVCVVRERVEDAKERERTEHILKELADEAEDQLQLRKLLLNRTKALQEQINAQKRQPQDEFVLPPYGLLKPVSAEQVKQRKLPFPMPDEVAASGKQRRSAHLPVYNESLATEEEMAHLPTEYWNMIDSVGGDRTPVYKNDMERVAIVESLGLDKLLPSHPTALALKRITAIAVRLFNVVQG